MAASRTYGIVWRWHFIIGLIACPIVLVVALTGALYVFQPELDPALDPETLVVTPGERRVPIDDLVAAAKLRKCTASGYVLPSRADRALSIYCVENERVAYFDPYRGDFLGERTPATGVFGVIFKLHWDLLLGEPGRIAIEWATSCVVVLLVTGVVLWWPRGKRRRGGVWWPRRGLGTRQWLRDLHAVAGAYMMPVLLLVAATGLMWTVLAGQKRWHPLTEDVVHEMWDHPPSSTVIAGAAPIGLERALAVGNFDKSLAVYGAPPATPTGSYVLLSYDDSYEAAWLAESVWVDQYSGKELARLGWEHRSIAGKIDSAAYSVHVGAILGLPGRIVVCLAALALSALCITGPWMWWKRRPAGKLGAPPRSERRAWPLIALLVALGCLLPAFGIMVLAVGVFEFGAWLWRSRTAVAPPPASP
jgi:uncharacterized iron-regulated membrane protein